MTTQPRRITCRYLRGRGDAEARCTGEVVDEAAELQLCSRHLAMAWQLIKERMPGATQ